MVQRGSFSGKFQRQRCFVPPGAAALWCKSCYREELSPWVGKPPAHALCDVAVTRAAVFWLKPSASFTEFGMCAEWSIRQRPLTTPVLESWFRDTHKEFSRIILQLVSFPDVFHHFFPTNNLCYIWKWCFSLLTASEYEKAGVAS